MLRHALDDDTYLRLPELSDAEELTAVVDANRGYLAEWLPWAPANTLESNRAFIREARQKIADDNGLELVIIDREAIVGMLGLHAIVWPHRQTSVGYWLAESSQGRGIMTRAVQTVVDYAFGAWGLHRVEIRAARENVRSRGVPERLGFSEEGVLRQAERVGDRWLDLVVYGRLAVD